MEATYPDGGRMTANQAHRAMLLLERAGWRAEVVPLALTMHPLALVEVRDLSIRCHPLVATIRYPGETERWLQDHPHGLRGRGRGPSDAQREAATALTRSLARHPLGPVGSALTWPPSMPCPWPDLPD